MAGCLIAAVTYFGGEPALGRFEQQRSGFLVGRTSLAAGRQVGKGRARLDRQLIEREMFAGDVQRLVESRSAKRPGSVRAGRRSDRTSTARMSRACRSRRSPRAVMGAAEKAQRLLVERLDAERQAVDAGLGNR